jgi:hypothetical protein
MSGQTPKTISLRTTTAREGWKLLADFAVLAISLNKEIDPV